MTRWRITASRKQGQRGWLLHARSETQARLPVWFLHRRDAVALQGHLQAGLTLDAAYRALYAAGAAGKP